MKAHFKYPRGIDGKHYVPGEHSLPDALADHWYLKALVKQGDVALLDEPALSLPVQESTEVSSDEPALKDELKQSEDRPAPQSQKKKRGR